MEDITLYNVIVTSKILGVNKNKVYEYIRAGILQAINFGGGLKIRKSTLEKFISDYEGYDLSDVNDIHRLIDANALRV